MTSQNIKIISK